MFIETSAKGNFNIKLLFRRLATALPGIDNGANGASGANGANPNLVDITIAPDGGQADVAPSSGCAC